MTNISFGLDIDIIRRVFEKDICFDKKEQVYPTRVMVGVGWWISTSSRQGCSFWMGCDGIGRRKSSSRKKAIAGAEEAARAEAGAEAGAGARAEGGVGVGARAGVTCSNHYN